MLKLIAATAFVGTLALGSVASADNGQRALSWEQLQQACQNPAAFQSQRQPNAIRLTCEDSQLVWEADQSDTVEIDNQRSVTASLSSDKYYVVKQAQGFPVSESQTSCPRFKEVAVSYTKSFSLTCQEIQAYQGNMAAFCQGKIDSDLGANKSLATRTPTGRVYDMCAAPALISEQPKGQPVAPGGGTQAGGTKAPAAQPGMQPGGRPTGQPGVRPNIAGGLQAPAGSSKDKGR